MTKYVVINKINGRYEWLKLVEGLNNKGIGDHIEYWPGDNVVSPHFRFENEQDALVYVLTYGGEVTDELPWIVDKVLTRS